MIYEPARLAQRSITWMLVVSDDPSPPHCAFLFFLPSMPTSQESLERSSDDLFNCLLDLLPVNDILALGSTCKSLRARVNGSAIWEQRLIKPFEYYLLYTRGKRMYAADLSVVLGASSCNKHHPRQAPPVLELPEQIQILQLTLDVWFCLPSSFRESGGPLFALQDRQLALPSVSRPSFSNVLAFVTSDRALCCSVRPHLNTNVVVPKLETDTWYHVALVFDGALERVHVNRDIVYQSVFDEDECMMLRSESVRGQLGRAYVLLREEETSNPGIREGYQSFFGIVDECRLWLHALSSDQVRSLTRGLPPRLWPLYSLKEALLQIDDATDSDATRIRCSRPLEGSLRLPSTEKTWRKARDHISTTNFWLPALQVGNIQHAVEANRGADIDHERVDTEFVDELDADAVVALRV